MARPPYHIARQEHLGDALDDLARRGRLAWDWDYEDRSAIYWITVDGSRVRHDTKSAEQLAQGHFDELETRWKPVPHPGGKAQLAATLARLEAGPDSNGVSA